MDDTQTSWWARVYWNEKFLCIEALSGRGMMQADPDSAQHLLSLDVGDEMLGRAVQDALVHSRLLTMEEIAVFFNLTYSKTKYDAWVADLMKQYGYKTRRALFKHMLSCGVRQQAGTITFAPSRHDRLEGWGRTKSDIAEGMTDEVIAETESSEMIGAALRRAMSRCR
jgi:hypothetical protein